MTWPDLERAAIDLLAPLVDNEEHIGTTTPARMDAALPFLRVHRFGGPRDDVTDYAVLDLDAFGATREEALGLMLAALSKLTAGERPAGGPLIDRARVRSGPTETPWANASVRRWSATCEITARRR